MRFVLDEVSFRYGSGAGPVLEHFSMEVHSGQSLALMGPSGSGKSTILGLLGGVLAPNSGRVIHDTSEDLAGTDEICRPSWIFQSSPLLPYRTCVDNASIEALGRGVKRADAEQQARLALTQVGLGHLQDRRCVELSGGEAQRVGIARAIAAAPSLVLADEPTAQLDGATKSGVMEALLLTTQTGAALVMATHDESVAELCDRTVRLQ